MLYGIVHIGVLCLCRSFFLQAPIPLLATKTRLLVEVAAQVVSVVLGSGLGLGLGLGIELGLRLIPCET